jgi:O-antigen ligase
MKKFAQGLLALTIILLCCAIGTGAGILVYVVGLMFAFSSWAWLTGALVGMHTLLLGFLLGLLAGCRLVERWAEASESATHEANNTREKHI